MARVRVSVSLERIGAILLAGRRFISIGEVAELLGVSTRAAGVILAGLERMGLVERWSRRVYRVVRRPEGRLVLVLRGGLARRLGEVARREGLAPEELIQRIILEYLESRGV